MPFDTQTGPQAARRSHATDSARHQQPRRLSPLAQALAIQESLYKATQLLSADLPSVPSGEERARIASAISNAAKAWQSTHAEELVIRGHGKPRPVTARNDPDAKPRRKAPITEAKPAE